MNQQDDQSKRLQVNVKSPGGTLINIYAASEAELSYHLEAVERLVPQIAALEGVIVGTSAAASVAAPPSQQPAAVPSQQPAAAAPWEQQRQQPQHQPQHQPQQGQSATPQCQHGARQFKQGTSRDGRPWRAWMCPAPKGQSCPPEWVRD